MRLDEFLLARIAEDEEAARWRGRLGRTSVEAPFEIVVFTDSGSWRFDGNRLLAECAAKRAIVEAWRQSWAVVGSDHNPGVAICDVAYSEWDEGERDALERAMRLLAQPYADHPDYDQSWSVQ